jgi:hypothetical protein
MKTKVKILQNIFVYPYKTQVQITMVSMTLHNYIRRKSYDNVIFIKGDHMMI